VYQHAPIYQPAPVMQPVLHRPAIYSPEQMAPSFPHGRRASGGND